MLILAAAIGAIIYALGVVTGSSLYYRANQGQPPITVPKPKFKARPARRDEELEE